MSGYTNSAAEARKGWLTNQRDGDTSVAEHDNFQSAAFGDVLRTRGGTWTTPINRSIGATCS
jgi:hypothetical protein